MTRQAAHYRQIPGANTPPPPPSQAPGVGFLLSSASTTLPNGQTTAQFANSKLGVFDLVQATYAQRSLLSSITTANMSMLVGATLTSGQIADALVQCQAGGANARAMQYVTWSDETVTDLVNNSSSFLNGYVLDLGPSTTVFNASINAGDSSFTVTNGTTTLFPGTLPFPVLVDSELVTVTTITNPGIVGHANARTFAISGTFAGNHALLAPVLGVGTLNASINNNPSTTSPVGTATSAWIPGTGNTLDTYLIGTEQVEVVSGTNPSYTVLRRANGTSIGSHTAGDTMHLIWNDQGIISFNTQCHAAVPALKSSCSPLGQQVILAIPTVPALASSTDYFLFETQRSQPSIANQFNDTAYITQMQTTVGQIRTASGGKPIAFQMNAYDASSATVVGPPSGKTPYDINALIATTNNAIAACNLRYPDVVTMEYDGRSLQNLQDWVNHFRP